MSPLFEKLSIGCTELPNRICFMAHRTNFGRQRRLTDRHIAYYQRRARGECGLITIGELSISPTDQPYESMIALYGPEAVDDFRKLTRAVHKFDTRVFAQLGHHGFQSSGHITRNAVWAPSAMADIAFGETGKAMEEEDMDVLARSFGRAAEVAREGGFDGIEIDMGPESLFRQFLSPISNHRQDEYGGSIENRMRLPLRVLDAVHSAVGDDFTVGLQLCVDEKFWGGINPEESVQFARLFEQTGQVDYIQVAVATYYNLYLVMASMHTPGGFTLESSEQLKHHVNIPVIAGYQIDFPKMAEEAIVNDKADAVGFVRPLIADPDMAKKNHDGKTAQIRYCARDNQGCVSRINQSKPITCVQNPNVGWESTSVSETIVKADKPKRVVVMGAGPAGMAAAVTAAKRGHSVTLYEREDKSGGQVNLSLMGAGRSSMARMTRYLESTLTRLEVSIFFNTPMHAQDVMALNADAVVIATGCVPVSHPYPGEYGPPTVLTVWDVLKGSYPWGEKILFIDEIGNHSTLACAELLAEQDGKVDLVTNDLFVGIGIATLGDLYFTRQRLLQKGVTFQTDIAVDRIEDRKVFAKNVFTNRQVVFEGYDTIIAAVDFVAVDQLYHDLKGKILELYRIGDCVAPRGIEMAIYEGEKVGSRL